MSIARGTDFVSSLEFCDGKLLAMHRLRAGESASVNKRKVKRHIRPRTSGPVVTERLLVPTIRERSRTARLSRSRPHGHARPDADRPLQGLRHLNDCSRIPALSPRDVLPAALDRPVIAISTDRRGAKQSPVRQNSSVISLPAVGFFCETPLGGKRFGDSVLISLNLRSRCWVGIFGPPPCDLLATVLGSELS